VVSNRITSIPACRKNRCTEKSNMYFDLKHPIICTKICTHFNISYTFYKLCSIATPGHPKLIVLENRIYIVAFTPDL
jgi:hypothetical protein